MRKNQFDSEMKRRIGFYALLAAGALFVLAAAAAVYFFMASPLLMVPGPVIMQEEDSSDLSNDTEDRSKEDPRPCCVPYLGPTKSTPDKSHDSTSIPHIPYEPVDSSLIYIAYGANLYQTPEAKEGGFMEAIPTGKIVQPVGIVDTFCEKPTTYQGEEESYYCIRLGRMLCYTPSEFIWTYQTLDDALADGWNHDFSTTK